MTRILLGEGNEITNIECKNAAFLGGCTLSTGQKLKG
jgi:hypothetical protein